MPKRLFALALNAAALLAAFMALPSAALAQGHQSPASALQAVISPLTKGAPYYAGQTDRWTIDGEWSLKPDPTNVGLRERWQNISDFSAWSPKTVPNAFNAGDASEASHRGSVGWYARQFLRPISAGSAKWILRFESVNYKASVWLNGRLLGTHSGGYVPFEVDASSMRSGVNTLVVRVDSQLNEYTVPPLRDTRLGTPNGGWWNFGGILREVLLRRVSRAEISNVAVHTSIACRTCAAKVDVRATVRNMDRRKLKISLGGHFGSVALRFPRIKMRGDTTVTVAARFTIDNPRLWSTIDPSLYPVLVNASVGRSRASSYRLQAGIRSLKVTNSGRVLLNFLPLQLRGTSLHEFSLTEGAAVSPQTRASALALVTELNANLLRSHYPLHPATFEYADRNGIMMWAQAPVFRVPDTVMRTARYRKLAVAMVREIVQANKHHPSVLVWSIGNEILAGNLAGIDRYARSAVKAIKSLDPNGLSGLDVAAAPASVLQQPGYRRVDILGLNEYFGWYAGTDGSAVNREFLPEYLDDFHTTYPRQGLFVTEFGAEANRDGPADEKGSYAFQTQFLNYHISAISQKSYISGILPWMLQDYWVRPGWDGGNPDPVPPMSSKGIVKVNGEKKPAFEQIAREFQNTPAFRP